jgi:hypothetical protein
LVILDPNIFNGVGVLQESLTSIMYVLGPLIPQLRCINFKLLELLQQPKLLIGGPLEDSQVLVGRADVPVARVGPGLAGREVVLQLFHRRRGIIYSLLYPII